MRKPNRIAVAVLETLKVEHLLVGDLENRLMNDEPLDDLVTTWCSQRARITVVLIDIERNQALQTQIVHFTLAVIENYVDEALCYRRQLFVVLVTLL